MLDTTDMSAREIVEKGLQIAGDICVYTNLNHSFEEIDY
jgi:ATP-dependent HslUV protease subunit HslV